MSHKKVHKPFTAKIIDPRVKSQARCQNKRSRGQGQGLWKLNGSGDMIKNKICNFLEFSHFSQFSIVIPGLFFTKTQILKN